MRLKEKLLILFLFLSFLKLYPEKNNCYFEHFSTDDGLPQFTITSIIQDRKGFLWFATWDGFSKYDGVSFINYKMYPEDDYMMKSNRIQKLLEDRYGNIWLTTYDNEVHCFDPVSESFRGLSMMPGFGNRSFSLSQIKIRNSGKVWLLSEKDGCICVNDSLHNLIVFDSSVISAGRIFDVFEDKTGHAWLLSDNGVYRVNEQCELINSFFNDMTIKKNTSFFTALSFENNIYFGSSDGHIWVYDYSDSEFRLFQTPTNSEIRSLKRLNKKEFVMVTKDDGFFIFNPEQNSIRHYSAETDDALKDNNVKLKFVDSAKNLWFETLSPGIYRYDAVTEKIKHFIMEVPDPMISAFPAGSIICEDSNGNIFVHMKGGGIGIYDNLTDSITPLYNNEKSSDFRFSAIASSMFVDNQDILWLCTRSLGLEKIIFSNKYFRTLTTNKESKNSYSNNVRALLEDRYGRVWVAVRDGRVNIYDNEYNLTGSLSADGHIADNANFPGVVYSMHEDRDGNIWLGTKNNGIYLLRDNGDGKAYSMEHYKNDRLDKYSVSDNQIYSIYSDSFDHIWIGTFGGGLNLVRYDASGKIMFINPGNELKNYPIDRALRVRAISENRYGNICVCTSDGLIMFNPVFDNTDDINFRYFTAWQGRKDCISNNDILGVCNTKSGEQYYATFGGGLNKVMSYDMMGFPTEFKAYDKRSGFPSDVCLNAIEDVNGMIWISMENNLVKFDPMTERFESFAEIKQLTSRGSFSEGASIKRRNGEMMFGYSNGVLHFRSEDINKSNYSPYVALTGIRLETTDYSKYELDEGYTNIDCVKDLKLAHYDNSFSISFSALDYILPGNIHYAYKLEGFDKEWKSGDKQRVAAYTNIPKGDYIFKVKSTNSDGIWCDNERSINITILPSFSQTVYARCIIIVIVFVILYIIAKVFFTIYKLRKDFEFEKKISDMKLKMFTDISHEIRTPLTMISGPVDLLSIDDNLPSSVKDNIECISANTKRLTRLINQILDLNKLTEMKLHIEAVEIRETINAIAGEFAGYALSQKISFIIDDKLSEEIVWVDRDAFYKILTNILSNAFKYTQSGGEVSIVMFEDQEYIYIDIKDTGTGISDHMLDKLFIRFSSFNTDKSKPSTGLGLSIVRELIDKHSGEIVVNSQPGKGSVFSIRLRKGNEHYGDMILTSKDIEEHNVCNDLADGPEFDAADNRQEDYIKPLVLVVEDDLQLRMFIKKVLETEYHVIDVDNGVQALEALHCYQFSMIITDVMMPQMDGFELLKRIKADFTTSHIPVIMLTARTDIDSKLCGISYGADDYIPKPFSVVYFRTRIHNIMSQRRILQQYYRDKYIGNDKDVCNDEENDKNKADDDTFVIIPEDDVFIRKVINLVEAKIGDADFNIDDICRELLTSRSTFFNKIKTITGITPFELIKGIKMKRSKELLESGQYLVKEVAVMVGMSDVKHFRKTFKSVYGINPQEAVSEKCK